MSDVSRKLKKLCCPYTAAVVVAAGSGTRFGSDKLMAALDGVPVLARTLSALEASDMIHEIVVVARRDALVRVRSLCGEYGISKVTRVTSGGETRTLSCLAGVSEVSDRARLIAIHDGARPLVTEDVIQDALWTAYRHTAAVPAVAVRDTIKQAADGQVTGTPERSGLFAVQTPQCFDADLIRAALRDAAENAPDITDDCMAVERLGGKVFLSRGSEENIKITTPLDLALGEIILSRRKNA